MFIKGFAKGGDVYTIFKPFSLHGLATERAKRIIAISTANDSLELRKHNLFDLSVTPITRLRLRCEARQPLTIRVDVWP